PGYQILGEHRRGGLAELVSVPLANIHKLPSEIRFEEGAAPLLVGMTCWRMLFRRAALKAGESVLVVGAGGGVNSLSVAFARAAGAYVVCLAGSTETAERALQVGADEAINYEEVPQWHVEILKRTKGRGVDVVVDNVGQATMNKSLRAVTRGGR